VHAVPLTPSPSPHTHTHSRGLSALHPCPSCPSQLDSTAKALIDELSELMCRHMHTFDARGLANATWAFGKMK
jgi:hypothetical protein